MFKKKLGSNVVTEEACINCVSKRSFNQMWSAFLSILRSWIEASPSKPRAPVLESNPLGDESREGTGKRSDLINHIETVHHSIHF